MRPTFSRHRYREFREAYQQGRLDEAAEARRDVAAAELRSRGGRSRRDYLRDYVRWLRPHGRALALVFLLALLAAALQMVEPLFMRFIVDRVLLNPRLTAAVRLARLNVIGAAFIAVILAAQFLNAGKDYRQRLLNARLMLALRRSLYERLLHLPLATLWEMKTGGILSRLTGDVETATGLLQMVFLSPAISLVRLGIAAAVLFAINWRMALTVLTIVPGVVAISFTFTRRIRPIYRSLRRDAEEVDGRVGETFSGIRVVRAFRREVQELFTYMVGRHTVLRKEMFAQRRELVLWTSWGLLEAGINVAIVWYGGFLNLVGRASIGDIMAFQWYATLILGPVWSIVNTFSDLQRSLAAMERVFEVLAMREEMPDQAGASPAPNIVRELALHHVEFEYRPGIPVVRDFSVAVPGGSVVALVGRSGAGKTTVTDLVARFHDPTRGQILLNGVDIREFQLRTYRDLLAIVQQHVFLFDGTVRENIAYGRSGATDSDVESAARRANAHEFIAQLPEGYETLIGERGVKLSGGQQQRLAIARAIVAAPQILILDEATSNLDTESELLIQASMASLLAAGSQTTFVIAHRLSTVRRADLILLMEEGRIVERGTHEELMRAEGLYHQMVIRQMDASRHDAADILQ